MPSRRPGEQLLPSEVPLFQTGRSRGEFWNAATDATYKQVPTMVVHNMNVLAVNVWDACGRKKTRRPQFVLEPKIKERVLRFMGGSVDVDARHDPSLSRAALTAFALESQKKLSEEILRNLVKHLRSHAEKGERCVNVHARDVLPERVECRFAGTWNWLFDRFPPLRSTIEGAGFRVPTCISSSQCNTLKFSV